MKPKKLITIFVAVGVVAACVGEGSVSKADLASACSETTNWNDAGCDCMADKAKEDLSSDGQRLLYATLTGDQAQAEKLARSMSVEDAAQSGMFMVQAGLSCAAAAAGGE